MLFVNFFNKIITSFRLIVSMKTIGLSVISLILIFFIFSIPSMLISRILKDRQTRNITVAIMYFLFSGVFLAFGEIAIQLILGV